MKRGKKYLIASKKIDRLMSYEPLEACNLVKEVKYSNFDETVEAHVRLNLKKSQTVRDTVVLPNQFREEKRVLVFCKPERVKEAMEHGAAYAGDMDLIEKIKGGWLDFDIAVATPDMMKDVGKLGMILGRKGLMPNPKTGTVTNDLAAALAELRKGRTEFRSDKTNIVHLSIGKLSMEPEKVAENLSILLEEINRKRPADTKGEFVTSVFLASSMGPSVRIALAKNEKR